MKYFTHAQKYLNSELFTILTCVPYRHTRVHSAWLTLPFDWLFQSNMCLIIRSRRYLYKSPSFIFFLNHIDSHLSYCFTFNYSKEHTVSYKGTVFFFFCGLPQNYRIKLINKQKFIIAGVLEGRIKIIYLP